MRVRYLSSREKNALRDKVGMFFSDEEFRRLVMKGDVREVLDESGNKILLIGEYVFIVSGERVVPALTGEGVHLLDKLPSVRVDRGAIPHVASGAHIMRPGITRFEQSFKSGDLVVVRDETYGKPLAVGIALEDSEKAEEMQRGKILANIHHVDDKFWKLAQRALGG